MGDCSLRGRSKREEEDRTGARRRLWKREKRERENAMYQQPHYQQPYDPEMGYGKTEEEGGMDYAAFMEKEVRRGFIRKVFSILAVQLLVTFGCAVGFASSAPLKAYATQNAWPFYVSIPLLIGSMAGLLCCGDLHRRFPHNYALLGARHHRCDHNWPGALCVLHKGRLHDIWRLSLQLPDLPRMRQHRPVFPSLQRIRCCCFFCSRCVLVLLLHCGGRPDAHGRKENSAVS